MIRENSYLSPFSKEKHLAVSGKPFVAKKVIEVVAVDLQKHFIGSWASFLSSFFHQDDIITDSHTDILNFSFYIATYPKYLMDSPLHDIFMVIKKKIP